MATQEELVIKVKVDAREAERGFTRFNQAAERSAKQTGKAGRASLGKSAFSALGVGRLAGAAGVGAFAGSAIGDAFAAFSSPVSGIAREFSRALGLRGLAGEARAKDAAEAQVASTLGLGIGGASDQQLEDLFNIFRKLEEDRQKGLERLERIADVKRTEPLLDGINALRQSIDKLAESQSARVERDN